MQAAGQLIAQGVKQHQGGALEVAEKLYHEALRCDPRHPDALHMLGVLAYQRGQSRTAVEYLCQAISANNVNADYYCTMGAANHDLGCYEEAVANYQQALKLDPGRAEAYNNLGNSLSALGRSQEAVAALQHATFIAPRYAKAHLNLARALQASGDDVAALASLQRVVEIEPNNNQALALLADSFHRCGRYTEAIDTYECFLEFNPTSSEAVYNRGLAQLECFQLEDSRRSFENAIRLRPDLPEAHNNLGIALLAQGRVQPAIDSFRAAIRVRSDYAAAHSNVLMAMHYDLSVTDEEMLCEHLHWAALHERPEQIVHSNVPDPNRRLRIGYVSPDLRTHAVASFFEPILKNHNRENCEITCYADVRNPDSTTQRLKGLSDRWRNTFGRSENEFVQIVQQDETDILVDLAGHTSGNRLLGFGKKPAPIGVTYFGYGSTTGLTGMDYRIADIITDPEHEPSSYSETLIRHPLGFSCYAPPVDAPSPSRPPCVKNGYITFGSFNNIAKLNLQVVQVWVELMRALPASRLLLKTRSFNDPAVVEHWRAIFLSAGLARERLEIMGRSATTRAHLDEYSRIDIALDPFPYTGSTTTCEALWMGVPVVTLSGNSYVGRMSSSILTRVGLAKLISSCPEDYISTATNLADDSVRLSSLRDQLRSDMSRSSLCNGEEYTLSLEQIYRDMWHRWCHEARRS